VERVKPVWEIQVQENRQTKKDAIQEPNGSGHQNNCWCEGNVCLGNMGPSPRAGGREGENSKGGLSSEKGKPAGGPKPVMGWVMSEKKRKTNHDVETFGGGRNEVNG